MRPEDAMRQDFRLVDAEWPCRRAHEICEQRGAAYIVIERRIDDDLTRHYVFGRDDLGLQVMRTPDKSVHRALRLEAMEPARVFSAGMSLDATADGPGASSLHGVFMEDGRLVGVVMPGRVTRGGDTRGPVAAVPATSTRRGSTTAPGTVERRLTGRLPAEVEAHSVVSLIVALSDVIAASSADDVFELPVGTTVDVVVAAGDGLTVIGADSATLTVADPQPDAPLLFRLRSSGEGIGRVTVYAFCNNVSIAALKLSTIVKRIASDAVVEPATVARTFALPSGPRPDLSMYIYEEGNALRFQLQSADGSLNMQRYGPVDIAANAQAWFRTFFADIETMEGKTPAQRKTLSRKLAAKGVELFDKLFPDDLKTDLWGLRDRISTIQITSEEPWIPWELCRMAHRGAEGIEEGPFLANFCITRWLYGVSAARSLPITDLALVAPGDSGLDNAEPERQFVLSLAGDGRVVTEIEPTFIGVTDAMIGGHHDAWHFVGHASADPGVDADRSSIRLRDRETLSPSEVTGSVANCLRTRPFVFLNACQTARGGGSLTSVGGWAQRLLKPNSREAAAAAFIGTLWSVDDRAALDFSTVFYRQMLAGQPIGEAVRAARAHVRSEAQQREDGDDTSWLAYTVYADPSATIARRNVADVADVNMSLVDAAGRR